ncbi:hypothetical protein BURKHO8Y_240226 [Burkholderia sp. 8Y]|uniref:hypothetical protein n=1 Tax=Burkholderia sp. 8Y TaxID=2653133 RepID=UPI0012F2B954|nr:hypothetical protein [Burkholderia sp. 8Y]VXC60047.1 hypothetical protein BURKHO8Y_240226 [Burkholderia sp. 8Y]
MTVVVNIAAALEADEDLVHMRDGLPVIDSLVIAREFGRRHDNVLQTLDSLIADGTMRSRLHQRRLNAGLLANAGNPDFFVGM